MADGELFVTGRANELIIRLGRKYHPEDIERCVQLATGLAPGSCVAFFPCTTTPATWSWWWRRPAVTGASW